MLTFCIHRYELVTSQYICYMCHNSKLSLTAALGPLSEAAIEKITAAMATSR